MISTVYLPKMERAHSCTPPSRTPSDRMTPRLKIFLPTVCPSFRRAGISTSQIRQASRMPSDTIRMVNRMVIW